LAQIQSNWIPNTRNFQAQPVPGDCFTTIPGCQRCELTPTGPVCWQCLFNFKQTSFVLSQTLGFPTGFCGEQQGMQMNMLVQQQMQVHVQKQAYRMQTLTAHQLPALPT
jgi:hypothetical protein